MNRQKEYYYFVIT